MRILITGGLGFIGSHLAASLVVEKHRLVILDDLSAGKREHAPAGSEIIIDDVAKEGVFDKLLDGVDACYHLAAIASVERSHHEWVRTHQVNVGGFVNLLSAIAKRKKPVPVVFASSAAVYGTTDTLPLKETAATRPISAYGADKLACELHGRVADAIHHIPTIGMRFFNVYGPRQDPTSPYTGVISIFAQRALQNQPLIINGDGLQSRDFIYVEDVVKALKQAMARLTSGAVRHGIYNVCTGQPTTVKTLAHLISETVKVKDNFTHGPARAGDLRHSFGSGDLAAMELSFQPRVPLADGLRDTIQWLKEST